jgi:hypothetical protein
VWEREGHDNYLLGSVTCRWRQSVGFYLTLSPASPSPSVLLQATHGEEEEEVAGLSVEDLADVHVLHLREVVRVDTLVLQIADHLLADGLELGLVLDELGANQRALLVLHEPVPGGR